MAHGVRGKRRGNTVDVSDLVEAAIELLRLGDLLLPLIDHRQGVLHRGQRLQIAGAVVDGDTLRDCRPRHSKGDGAKRSEEHPSELQSLMRISYAVFCL